MKIIKLDDELMFELNMLGQDKQINNDSRDEIEFLIEVCNFNDEETVIKYNDKFYATVYRCSETPFYILSTATVVMFVSKIIDDLRTGEHMIDLERRAIFKETP